MGIWAVLKKEGGLRRWDSVSRLERVGGSGGRVDRGCGGVGGSGWRVEGGCEGCGLVVWALKGGGKGRGGLIGGFGMGFCGRGVVDKVVGFV